MRNTRYLGAPLQSNYWTGDKLVIPDATYQGASIQPWGSGGIFDPNNLPAPLPPGENPQGDVQDQGGQSGGGLGGAALAYGPTILGAANKAYGLFSEGGQTAVEAGADYLKGTEFYRDMFGPDVPPVDDSLNLFNNPDNIRPTNPAEGINPDASPMPNSGTIPGDAYSPPSPEVFDSAAFNDAGAYSLNAANAALGGPITESILSAYSSMPSMGVLSGSQGAATSPYLLTGTGETATGLSSLQGAAGAAAPLGTAAANAAALGYGGVPITAAHPALSGAGLLGSGQSINAATSALSSGALSSGLSAAHGGLAAAEFGAGGFFGAGAGGAAATPALGGLAAFAPAAMLALPFLGRALLHEETDPTLNKRLTRQFEDLGQGEGTDAEKIEGMEKAIYANHNLYDLARIATSGRSGDHKGVQVVPFGTKPTDGSTGVVGWSPGLSALVNENMGRLQAASNAGQMNASGMGSDGPDKYHPIYKPDPNTYEDIAGEYGLMERRLVGGPAFDAMLEGA
tara:strand:+ start:493 stop:2028 length:1536 start_codon:yes stop_codon:yes gene_type:complete